MNLSTSSYSPAPHILLFSQSPRALWSRNQVSTTHLTWNSALVDSVSRVSAPPLSVLWRSVPVVNICAPVREYELTRKKTPNSPHRGGDCVGVNPSPAVSLPPTGRVIQSWTEFPYPQMVLVPTVQPVSKPLQNTNVYPEGAEKEGWEMMCSLTKTVLVHAYNNIILQI